MPLPRALLITLVALALFVPGLGAVHLFDWDEINFAEIAREMHVTGNFLQPQIDFKPFHEKPPLFIWLQAASMAAFGVNEFAARFPDAVCGVITLLVLYGIGRRLRGEAFGLLWALAYVGSILPHLYFRSGIIDPWFNLFIFLGIDRFIRMGSRHRFIDPVLGGVFLGMAVMTKGPVGVLIPGLTVAVMLVLSRFRLRLPWGALVAIGVGHGGHPRPLVRGGPDAQRADVRRGFLLAAGGHAHHGRCGSRWLLRLSCRRVARGLLPGIGVRGAGTVEACCIVIRTERPSAVDGRPLLRGACALQPGEDQDRPL
ncbi:MAG: glycosyltransferase family 39 protein [Flavobacteriales bacterium]|nr:glycosyltransferase family 39 protein [Flavobacteriales bacterium]